MVQYFVKPVNLFLAANSFLKSVVLKSSAVSGMPVSVGVELTNECNLHCPECASGSGGMQRERGYMSIELFEKIITELSPSLYNINLYFQGESMMHPLFFLFLEKCRNIPSTVSTNGHFLTEKNAEALVKSGLNKLIISLDGMDQETYSAYRKNGSLDIVLQGIRNVSEAKKQFNSPINTEIQFLVNRLNEHQIPLITGFARSTGVSVKLKSMQILDKKDMERWLPTDEKYRRYRLKDGEYVIKSRLPDRCARLWFNPVITWDGKVVPCCFDKNADHVMGDVNCDSFREIWDGPKYRIFRKSIVSGRHMIDICRNCTSGLHGVKY
jgi:radical SAM protein with 4Fe4S-binding SPASM domain